MPDAIRRHRWQVLVVGLVVSILWSGEHPWAVRRAEAAPGEIPGPAGSGAFGTTVAVLPNGNVVVTDPTYSKGGLTSIGAVYLYNGATLAVISILKGSTTGDEVGKGGIMVLSNGKYVVSSPA